MKNQDTGEKAFGQTKAEMFWKKSMPIFLFLSIFMLIAGKYLFCAMAMSGKQAFLSEKEVAGKGILAIVFAVLFLYMAFLSMSTEKGEWFFRIVRTLIALLPLGFVTEIICLFYPRMMDMSGVSSVKKWFLIRVIVIVLALLVLTVVIFSAVLNTIISSKHKGVPGALLMLITHPLHFILFLLMFCVSFLLSGWAHMVILFVPITSIRYSFTVNVMLYLLESILTMAAMYATIIFMRKKAKVWEAKKAEANENKQAVFTGFSLAGLVVAGILLIVNIILLFPLMKMDTKSPKRSVLSEIDESISMSSGALLAGDLNGAYENMQIAQVKINTLKSYMEDEEDSLSENVKECPDEVLNWILYLDMTGNLEELEEYVITKNPYHDDLRMLLFENYSHMKNSQMTKQQKSYRQELVKECIATQSFTSELPKEVKSSKAKKNLLKKMENQYGFVDGYTEALLYLMDTGRKGEISSVTTMIEIAQKYPDDVTLQYLAGVMSAAGATDNASYYDSAKECILRFVELSEDDKKVKKDELMLRKLKAAELLIRVKGYEEADELLDDIEVSGDRSVKDQIGILRLYCADRNEDVKECYQTAKELMIEEGMDNALVYYFYGVGALKQGKEDEMTDALESISEIILDEELTGKDLVNAETSFYIMLQYAVVSDNTQWTEYCYSYYEEMSDKDKNQLSDFLHDYMEAMNAYYNTRDYEYALEKIEDVLEEREDLSYALYLKGAILFSMEEFEDSAESYLSALELNEDNPTFLYALANTYDGMEDYSAAYEASGKVQEMFPLINHEEDWYGMGYHNGTLFDALSSKQGGDE